jgi:hypothetical protein
MLGVKFGVLEEDLAVLGHFEALERDAGSDEVLEEIAGCPTRTVRLAIDADLRRDVRTEATVRPGSHRFDGAKINRIVLQEEPEDALPEVLLEILGARTLRGFVELAILVEDAPGCEDVEVWVKIKQRAKRLDGSDRTWLAFAT